LVSVGTVVGLLASPWPGCVRAFLCAFRLVAEVRAVGARDSRKAACATSVNGLPTHTEAASKGICVGGYVWVTLYQNAVYVFSSPTLCVDTAHRGRCAILLQDPARRRTRSCTEPTWASASQLLPATLIRSWERCRRRWARGVHNAGTSGRRTAPRRRRAKNAALRLQRTTKSGPPAEKRRGGSASHQGPAVRTLVGNHTTCGISPIHGGSTQSDPWRI